MTDNLTEIMEAIAGDVLKLSQTILAKNDLKDSKLYKDMQVDIRNNDNSIVIETLFDNYIDYLEHGRRPMTGKQPPTDSLRDWALSKGIPTDNSTLFLVSRAIWRDGCEARPILATIEEETEKLFDEKWAEQIMEAITNELTKYFE